MLTHPALVSLLLGVVSTHQQVSTTAEVKTVIAQNYAEVTQSLGEIPPRPTGPLRRKAKKVSTTSHQEYVENLIREIFAPHGPLVVNQALSVSYSENQRRDCRAVSPVNTNGTVDKGIFQVNSIHHRDYPDLDFLDCRDNIIAAYRHYSRYGWKRWTNYRNGKYLAYMSYYDSSPTVAGWERAENYAEVTQTPGFGR